MHNLASFLFSLLITLLLLFATVARADWFINHPIADTVWRRNQPVTIIWSVQGGQQPKGDAVHLRLLDGNPDSLNKVAEIGVVNGNKPGSFEWHVPGDLKPRSDYVLQMGGGDGQPNHYSHQFRID